MPSHWKPLPRAVEVLRKRDRDAGAEERARGKVRKRDQYRCRVCWRPTKVVHEDKRRGAGGKVSLQNSFCACDVLDGGLCHPLLQGYRIDPVMASGAEAFNATEDLVFEMTELIAALVFKDRPRPAHVRIASG